MRRQRERPAGADARMREPVQRSRLVRYPCEHPRPFRQGGCRCAGERQCGRHLGGLGSRHVLHRSSVRFQRAARGRGLHVLGPRRLAGSQRRHSSHRGRGRCAPVHRARRLGARSRAQRREAAADHASEAHARVLRRGRGRCRPGGYREGHRRDAELLRRL